jgi:hypothetical protein
MDQNKFKYHHLGIPTKSPRAGEAYLKDYKCYASGFGKNEFGIEWMRYEDDCPLPEIVKTLPHIAFEVEGLQEAIRGRKVIIEPNRPSPEYLVAFVEIDGAPVEFIQIKK